MLIVLSYFATKIQNILYITKVFGKYYCRSVGTDPNFFIKDTAGQTLCVLVNSNFQSIT